MFFKQSSKTTLLTNIPTPYRLPLWRNLSNLVNLNVICISATEKNRNWKIEHDSYISILKSTHIFFSHLDWGLHFTIPFSLLLKLIKASPDAIIVTGYDNIQYWEALLYIKIFRKKAVFWNGSTLLSSRSKNKTVNFLKSFFIRSFDSYYTYGSKATEYLIHHGANPKKIITGTNTIDTEYFKRNTSNETINDGTLKFLYVGQLLERKGLENTLKAFESLEMKNWSLRIVGVGPDEEKLRRLVSNLHLENNIDFVGYKQKEEILPYFSNSNFLIMPSYLEVWGLVINEALASGLFCLSSKYAGATSDLITEGKNGFVIDPLDTQDIAAKLNNCFLISTNKKNIKEDFKITLEKEALKIQHSLIRALSKDSYAS